MASVPPTVILVAVSIVTLVLIFAMFFGRNQLPVNGRTIVVTGGSQGLGRGLGKVFAQKGANVVIVARDVKKLEAAVSYISSAALNPDKQRFHYISADVTSASENARILTEVTAWNNGNPPDIVWANAGMALPGLFLDTSFDAMRAQMDINYWAATYLAHATLKLWLSSPVVPSTQPPPARYFISTSSVAAFLGLAGYSQYSPAKSALRSLHDTLCNEMHLYNNHDSTRNQPEIRIATVFPATILSPGLDAENEIKPAVTKMLEEDDQPQTEDQVASIAVRELEKGRRIITTQIVASALRAGALGNSARDQWVVDTLFGWVMGFVWLFVGPDLAGKVHKWAAKNGVPKHG